MRIALRLFEIANRSKSEDAHNIFRWMVSAKTPLECNELQSILAIDPNFQLSTSTNVDCASSTKTCAAHSSRQKSLHLPALNINAHANGLVPRAHSANTHASILHDPKPRAGQSPQLFRRRRNVHGMKQVTVGEIMQLYPDAEMRCGRLLEAGVRKGFWLGMRWGVLE